jgi:SPP1 family predicted phage head-tail adaptor
MPYHAGQLRHRVTVQKLNRNFRNELGEVSERWETVETRSASVKSVRAMEKLRNAQAVEDVSHTIVMRWFEGFNSTDYRLIFEGRILDLTSVTDPDETRAWWEILANEQAAEATP